jgi:hypothetical protein
MAFEGEEGIGAADLVEGPQESVELALQLPSEVPPGALQRRTGRAPMAAAVVDEKRIILHRTVAISGAGIYEQGIVIDLDRLTGWLEARVLGARGLRDGAPPGAALRPTSASASSTGTVSASPSSL